ncbi:MAG TPA: CDP-alcohol phosphatidyltransferase family protein [Verrucomicrobiae bacterium]|nr:CDP-alcohol phosphatidyltransferase family protein [Verrucomicrobiae bacterium]
MGLTFANLLTVLRMALIPFFIIAVTDNRAGAALVIFTVAGITDLLDGIIARMWKQKTALGAILDPLADKLLLTAAFIILCMPDRPRAFPDFVLLNRVPVTLTILSISRDVIIALIAGVLYMAGGRTSFAPTILGKLTTTVEILTVVACLFYNWTGQKSAAVLPALTQVSIAFVVASGFHYIYHVTQRGSAAASDTRGDPR